MFVPAQFDSLLLIGFCEHISSGLSTLGFARTGLVHLVIALFTVCSALFLGERLFALIGRRQVLRSRAQFFYFVVACV